MKVYACPAEIPVPEVDYMNYNMEKEDKAQEKHQADLKAWLISKGYKGQHTGKVIYFGVADGHAHYMIADGKKSFLIHLPYGDNWHYQDVEFLPKKEIIRRLMQQEKMDSLFSKGKK
jgi:hypothetical protein